MKAGETYTKNGYDFTVQFIENGIAYGLQCLSTDRDVENFADTDKYCENLRISVSELEAMGAELVK